MNEREIQFGQLSADPRILGENQSRSLESRRFLRRMGGIVAVLSLGLCIGFDIHRQFYLGMPRRSTQLLAAWDGYIHKTMPGRGVFLKFVNFNGQSRQWAAYMYFRAVYVMYPRPVLVTEPSTVVNTAPQILQDNSYPSNQWLIDHGVGSIVEVNFDPLEKKPFVPAVKWLDP